MKKLLTILLLFCAVSSIAQLPITQNLGSDSTLIRIGNNSKGALRGSLIPSTYTDTTQANAGRIDDYPFAIIATSGDGNLWQRNYLATAWVLIGGGSDPSGLFFKVGGNLFPVTVPSRNIGTLAPYGGAIGLMTNSVVHAIVPDAGFTLSNDTTSTKIFTINPTSKEWGYANWNNGGGGGSGGGIGSFQDSVANLRDFGAVGDGVTDDSVAIKNAIATGRDVYGPKGTYFTNAINISPKAGQTIFGDGENTKFKTSQTDGAIFKVVNPNVKFMNLSFEGSGKTSSLPGWTTTTYQTGIWVMINSTTITGCTFRKFNGRGVYIFHPSATYIMNNTVINNRFFQNTVGIESDYGADYLLIANNSLDTNYACIVEGGNANVYYLGNQATQSTYGYYSRGGANHGSIVGGSFNHCTTGLRIPSGSQGMTITDTKFWYSDISIGATDTVSKLSFYNCVIEGSVMTLTKAKQNKWVGGYIYGPSAPTITGTGITFENVLNANAGLNEWYGKDAATDSSFTVKNGLSVGRGVLFAGIPTFGDTTSFKPLTVNAAGTVYRATYWPGGGSYSFTNGLTNSSGTVKLGGTLTENTSINGDETYSLAVNQATTIELSAAVSPNSSTIYITPDSIKVLGSSSLYFGGVNNGGTANDSVLVIAGSGKVFKRNSSAFSGSSGITVGTTTITSGTDTRVPFNDGGVYGEDAGFTYTKGSNRLNVDAIGTTGGLGYLTFDANGGGGNPDLMVDAGSLTLNLYNTWQFGWGVPLSSAIDAGLKRNAAAEVKITNGGSGTGDLVLRSSTFSGRNREGQGADVASANNLSLGTDGNTFEITGTTQVNLIANTNWQNGSEITLLLPSGITVKHGQATSGSNITISLSGAADLVTAAETSLTLVLSEVGGAQKWRQKGAAISY